MEVLEKYFVHKNSNYSETKTRFLGKRSNAPHQPFCEYTVLCTSFDQLAPDAPLILPRTFYCNSATSKCLEQHIELGMGTERRSVLQRTAFARVFSHVTTASLTHDGAT